MISNQAQFINSQGIAYEIKSIFIFLAYRYEQFLSLHLNAKRERKIRENVITELLRSVLI